MRFVLAWVIVLAACGRGGDERRERGAQPKLAAVPADAHASPALACVLELAAKRGAPPDVIEDIVDGAPAGGVLAIVRAVRERGRIGDLDPLAVEALAAASLADRGQVADARALLDGQGLAGLDDRVSVEIGVKLGEVRLRAGRSATVGGDRALLELRAQALGGDVDGAARAFAAIDTSRLGMFDVVPHLTALHALGREEEAFAVLATAAPSLRWAAHGKLAVVALASGRGVARAIDALVRARVERGIDWGQDRLLLDEVVRYARGVGRADAVAPVRRAIIDDLAGAAALDYDGESLAAELADEVEAVGSDRERAAMAPVLARLQRPVFARRVEASRALHRAELDAALAAMERLALPEPALWLRLWLRHAGAGLDAAFDQRLADVACRHARR